MKNKQKVICDMKKYENISMWRTIACLGVLFFHIFHEIYAGQLNAWLTFGKYGVLFFFIITGFLAFASVDVRENIWNYWKKRIIRIFPLCVVVQVLWLLIFSVEEKSLCKGWELLTADFVGGTWTIWVIAVFYFSAPFLVRLVNSYLKAWIAFMLLYIPRYLFIMYQLNCLDRTWQYLCFFMQGALIYYVFKESREQISLFLFACMLVGLKLSGSTDEYFIYSIMFMIMFVSTREVCFKHKVIRRVIFIVDKYSYNIFFMHPIVLRLIPKNSVLIFGILAILLTGIVSVVSYYCIDYPCKAVLLKRKVSKET